MSYSRYNSGNKQMSSWAEDSGFQTGRTGFGYNDPRPSKKPASTMDEKVVDADVKMADFMAEIAEMDTEEEVPLPAQSSEGGLQRTSRTGFVSAGHIIQSEAPADSQSNNPVDLQTIIEPTTVWQHLLDANTQHYYYWNMNTNQVTWTIPDEYSEYLVKHKLFREEVANYEQKGVKVQIMKDDEVQENATPSDDKTEIHNTEPEEPQTIIGPQLPKKKPPANEAPAQTEKKTQKSVDQQPSKSESADNQNSTHGSENQTSNKALSGLIGYSADQSDDEEEVDEDRDTPPLMSNGVVKSLVAYDVSYTMTQEELGDMVEVDEEQTETVETNPIPVSIVEPATSDAPLVFSKPADPPADPEPVKHEDPAPIVGPSYISSTGISEYYNKVNDKCECLDIYAEKGDVSQLQLLLIQLKTRLDDWNAGALKREYLMGKIREANSLIEDCESASTPVGWTCAWNRTDKKYYYIHDITEEISYTYPQDFIDSLQQVISLKDEPEPQRALTGTLSTLKTSITTISNKATNTMKALFAQQILLKLGPPEAEIENETVDEDEPEKTEGKEEMKLAQEEKKWEQSNERQTRDSSSERSQSTESSRDKKYKQKHKTKSKKKKQSRDSDSETSITVQRKSRRESSHDRELSSMAMWETRKQSRSRSRDRNRNQSRSIERSRKRSFSKEQRRKDKPDSEKEKSKKRKRSGSREKKHSKKRKHKKSKSKKNHKKNKSDNKKHREEGERSSDSDVIELGSSPEQTNSRDFVSTPSKNTQRADTPQTAKDSQCTPPTMRDSQRTPPTARDSQRKTSTARESRRSPSKTRDSQRTPPKTRDSRRTPPKTRDSRRTPPKTRDLRHTPPKTRDLRRTPPKTRVSRRTPPKTRDSRRTPPKARDSRRTPPKTRDSRCTPPKSRDSRHTSPKARDSQHNPSTTRDSLHTPSTTRDSQDNNPDSPIIHEILPGQKLLSLAEEALAKRREKMDKVKGTVEVEKNPPVFPIIPPKPKLVLGVSSSESDESSEEEDDAINLLDEIMNKKAKEKMSQVTNTNTTKESEPVAEEKSETPEVEEPSIDDILEGLSREFEEEKRKNNEDMEIASSPESVQPAAVVAQPAVLYKIPDTTTGGLPPPIGLSKPDPPTQSIPTVSARPAQLAKPPQILKPSGAAAQEQHVTASPGPTASGDADISPQITCKVKWKKKEKKTKGKMPDLVNKWKKVQTEMEKEIQKEQQLYKKLLKD